MIMIFFFNDTATTEIYPLSLHDALPIYDLPTWWKALAEQGLLGLHLPVALGGAGGGTVELAVVLAELGEALADRKSTRLNSSHANISYAVFCLKKKKNNTLYHHIIDNIE